MDKKKLKFIFFTGIPFVAGFLSLLLTLIEGFKNQSLIRGIIALSILFLSLVGIAYFSDKTKKILNYMMRSLSIFFAISSFSFCTFFLIFLIKLDFKTEHIPPRRGLHRINYDWSKFNIFSYLTVCLVIFLISALFIGAIFTGLWIDKKVEGEKKPVIRREEEYNPQYVKIKSIRIISTAQPLMINGRKIEKKDDSKLLNKVIYID